MSQLYEDIKTHYKETVKNFLNISDEKFDEFCSILKENKAVISGGSVAKSVFKKNWYVEDLDIYVNIKNAIPIRDFISNFCEDVYHKGCDDLYCNSFLHKNRIYKVVRFIIDETKHIDIMYVYNNKPIMEVINNFDLTCCQSWFDGENIFTSHPETIETNKCYMNQDYVKSLTLGNRFIEERLRKYTNRGFNISIPSYEINLQDFSSNRLTLDADKSIKLFIFNTVFGNHMIFRNTIFDEFFEELHVLHPPSGVPELIKDNYELFSEDGFDYEEFNCIEDYIKIGKKTVAEKVINRLKHILDNYEKYQEGYNSDDSDNSDNSEDEEINSLTYVSPLVLKKYKKALYEIFGFKNKEEIEKEFVNKYPEFKEICHDDISMTENDAGEFLSKSSQNIAIKCGERLMSFRRNEVVKFFKEKKKTIDKISTTETYLHHTILYDDVSKFNNPYFNLFILKDNGLKIKDKTIYVIEPISVARYLNI